MPKVTPKKSDEAVTAGVVEGAVQDDGSDVAVVPSPPAQPAMAAPPPVPSQREAARYQYSGPDGGQVVELTCQEVAARLTQPGSHFVWRAGWDKWQDAEEVPEIASLHRRMSVAPPVPAGHRNCQKCGELGLLTVINRGTEGEPVILHMCGDCRDREKRGKEATKDALAQFDASKARKATADAAAEQRASKARAAAKAARR